MFKTRQKPLIITSSVLLTLIIAWFASFEFAKQYIREDFNEEVAALKSRGFEVSYDQVEIGGNPFLVSAYISNLKLKAPLNGGGGETQVLKVSLRPWASGHLFFDFEGETFFDLPPYLNPLVSKISCQNCHAEVWLQNKSWGQIQVTSAKLSPVENEKESILSVSQMRVDLKKDLLTHRLHVDLSAKVLGADATLNLKGYDRPIDVQIKSEISNLTTQKPPQTLSAWRDLGGVLDVTQLSLDWEPLAIHGDGTFTFDEKMRPLAAFSTTILGYDRLLQVLTQANVIKKKTAQIATFVLGLLAHQNQNGEMEITVPITAQNGKLSVGPADLISLDPVAP